MTKDVFLNKMRDSLIEFADYIAMYEEDSSFDHLSFNDWMEQFLFFLDGEKEQG